MSDYTIYTIKLVTKDNDKYGIKEITKQQDDMPAKTYKIENDNDIDIIINSESKNFNEILDEFKKKSKSSGTNVEADGEENIEDQILEARLNTETEENDLDFHDAIPGPIQSIGQPSSNGDDKADEIRQTEPVNSVLKYSSGEKRKSIIKTDTFAMGGNKSKYSKKNTITKKNKSFKNKRSKK